MGDGDENEAREGLTANLTKKGQQENSRSYSTVTNQALPPTALILVLEQAGKECTHQTTPGTM